jgi:hypothetical protein
LYTSMHYMESDGILVAGMGNGSIRYWSLCHQFVLHDLSFFMSKRNIFPWILLFAWGMHLWPEALVMQLCTWICRQSCSQRAENLLQLTR